MFNINHQKINRANLTMAICLATGAWLPTINAAERYLVSADGQEVNDTTTRLIWRRCAEGLLWNGSSCAGANSYFNHEAALQQASNQASVSSKVWRLLNIKELSSITDTYRNPDPAIDTAVFPATPSDRFWSSTPNIGNASYAWYADFYDGYVNYGLRYGNYAVRLVRSAQ